MDIGVMTKVIQIPQQPGHIYAGRNLATINEMLTLPYSDDEVERLRAAGVRFTVSEPVRRATPPVVTKGVSDTEPPAIQ